ncbi:hypothetical protein [Pleurocapsa sp. FMAR1]|nr:hypothetical protein [Pleurocapsa sp. FMAR1]
MKGFSTILRTECFDLIVENISAVQLERSLYRIIDMSIISQPK